MHQLMRDYINPSLDTMCMGMHLARLVMRRVKPSLTGLRCLALKCRCLARAVSVEPAKGSSGTPDHRDLVQNALEKASDIIRN